MLKKLCAKIGCNETVPIGVTYCPKHEYIAEQQKADRNRKYDKQIRQKRDARYTAFYQSQEWKETKAVVIDHYKGLCLWSYYIDKSIVKAGAVHHIKPLREAWGLRLDINNLIPLSHKAHMMVEARTKAGDTEIHNTLTALKNKWEKEFNTQ